MSNRTGKDIHEAVRSRYANLATSYTTQSCCPTQAPGESSCCSPGRDAAGISRELGYTEADLASVPDGANLGLGCGNPQAIASLNPGEVVLDLGSGAGFDCFLAARAVGEKGRVIGVDMTGEMVDKARHNAERTGATNVEFRLGMIEELPVEDRSIDVLISNCVINLSPDKPAVYREAFRVLKPGGRIAISDMVAVAPIPEHVREDLDMVTGCIAGASPVAEVDAMLREAGFTDIRIDTAGGEYGGAGAYVRSATIQANRPR